MILGCHEWIAIFFALCFGAGFSATRGTKHHLPKPSIMLLKDTHACKHAHTHAHACTQQIHKGCSGRDIPPLWTMLWEQQTGTFSQVLKTGKNHIAPFLVSPSFPSVLSNTYLPLPLIPSPAHYWCCPWLIWANRRAPELGSAGDSNSRVPLRCSP